MLYSINNLDDIKKIFKDQKTPIFYVTNSVDHGVGLEKIIPNYHIICIDHDDEADYLEKAGLKVFCMEKESGKKNTIFRNSALLLGQKNVINYINKNSFSGQNIKPAILLFKPSASIEKVAEMHGWRILNNQAALSRELEDKLNFPFIAKSLHIKTPEIEILDLARMSYWELKKYYDHFVIQFKNGFAGNSTFFIKSKTDYAGILNRYAAGAAKEKSLLVKVSKFIKGIPVTVNACVASGEIYVGEPCYQITGEEVCTNSKSTTCGNDWSALSLSRDIIIKISEISEAIGRYLKGRNYKGIFGLDFIIGEQDNEVYLIEINPRLVASIPFYTKLEIKNSGVPILALHILEFLGIDCKIKDSGRKSVITLAPAVAAGADSEKNTGIKSKISGARLVIRNKERKNCVIGGELKSGVYSFEKNNLVYIKPGYSPDDMKSPREIVIIAAPPGRIVKHETEIAQIQSLAPLVSANLALAETTEALASEIYKKLKLKPV